MQRWTEYAVMDTDDNEIEGGPFESRASAERWLAHDVNRRFFGPLVIVEREMTASDWLEIAQPSL